MNEIFNVLSYVVSCLTFNLNFIHCINVMSAFIFGGWGSLPCREAGCLPPLHRAAGTCRPAGGRQAPTRGLRAKTIYICLHVGPCRPPAGRQAPASRQGGGRLPQIKKLREF